MNDLLPANPTDAQIERANAIIAVMNTYIDAVPEAGGDGILSILEQITGAENPEQLDQAWDTIGFGGLLGYRIKVTNLRKLKSDFKSTIPFYLIADVIIVATGEAKTATTGSYAIMAQLLTANAKNMLPMDFVPHEATEPTENGFYPQHLKVYRAGMPDQPAPAAATGRGRIPASRGRSREERFAEQIKADVAAQQSGKSFDVPENPEF